MGKEGSEVFGCYMFPSSIITCRIPSIKKINYFFNSVTLTTLYNLTIKQIKLMYVYSQFSDDNCYQIQNKNPMKVYKKRNGTACKCYGRGMLEIFSSPGNLQKIPETMGFQITDFDSKPMYAGQIIQYKVTPLWV
jgi:hypothetical protein